MILNNPCNQNTKKILFCVSAVLSIVAIILKIAIESSMIAAPATTIIFASVLISTSSFLLMINTRADSAISKYILLFSMFLLTIKEFLWKGSITSVILYVAIVFSLFKPIQHNKLKTIAIVDCVVKTLLTFWYIIDDIRYFGSFYYSVPTAVGLLASLCGGIGIWIMCLRPNNAMILITTPVITYATLPKVTCPYCKSTNTKKISRSSKAVSVVLWGIFALGKTTKQFHCNDCTADF